MSGLRGEGSNLGSARASTMTSSGSGRRRRSPATTVDAPPEHFDDANHYNGPEDAAENFKVVVRVRPPLPRELNGYHPFVDVVQISPQCPRSITLCDALETEDGRGALYSRQAFTFDHVYDASAEQQSVYEISAKPAVLSVLQGYNATLMAYGQTGTGKTYTMEGFTSEQERGIIPRSIEEIFAFIRSCRQRDMKFLVRASYMQIYNEVISDLLQVDNSVSSHGGRSLTVRHTPQRGVYVEGLSEWIVRTPRDVYGLIERGTSVRATSMTKMSELSSRSHAIFTVVVEVMEGDEARPRSYRFGKLNIVDLAGSEKVRQSGVSGQRLEETKSINKSLHELGNVIAALAAKTQNRPRHIPFRNSVLTSALRDSLGGNCRTTLIACISPALESYTESLSTLMFANRAKNIRNTAVINEDMDQATLLRKYERELKRLRQQLQDQERNQSDGARINPQALTALEEDRRRAEEDREAALEALYRSSQAHQEEQQLREMLEERIAELEAVLTNGGMSGAPQTSDAYNEQLHAELNRERSVMEEDTDQMQRYKALLLKQRDIMLSLTTRLNERDETILQLQEELDAYDAHVQRLEDRLGDAAEHSPTTPRPPSQSPPVPLNGMTQAEAEAYVAQSHVAAGDSADDTTSRGAYASDVDPARTLTADEKLVEVLMRSGVPRTAAGAGDADKDMAAAERQQQRQLLHRLAEDRARQWEARVKAEYDRKVYALQTQLTSAQDQLRVLNLGHSLLESDTPASEARRLLNEELHQIMAEHDARALQAQQALSEEQTKCRRLTRDVEQVRFELGKLREAIGASHGDERLADAVAPVQRQWQALQELVEGVWGRLAPSSADAAEKGQTAAEVEDTPSVAAMEAARASVQAENAARDRAWAAKSKEYEQRLEQFEKAVRAANAKPPTAAAKGAADTTPLRERLTKAERELEVQIKDRTAIQTILQQRIKTKVDDISTTLPELIPEKKHAEARARVLKEVSSLQKIVNAAIAAMQEVPEL